MFIIEPLHYYTESEPSLFLAGGITGCPDWQEECWQDYEDEGIPYLDIVEDRRQKIEEK